jgi:PAS domain S-box-containing protein
MPTDPLNSAPAPDPASRPSTAGPVLPPGYNVDAEALLALDLSKLAIWRRDLGADHMQFNARALAISGLPPHAGRVPVAVVRERIHPDDLHLLQTSVQDASLNLADQVGTSDVQTRWRHEDGGWRWLLTRRAVHRGADGQALALVGVAMDVTAQVEEAQRAEAMTRRFEIVTRTAGIGHWQHDAGDLSVHWSDTLRSLYGLAPGVPTPKMRDWLTHFVHPDDREEMSRRISLWTSNAHENLTMAHRILRPDGGVRHVLSHARRDTDAATGLTRASYGVAIDLTEQRQAEAALHRASERAALAAHGIGMGTWELNVNTGESFWDDQMWALRGLSTRAGPVKECDRVADVHPEDRGLFKRESYLSMTAGVPLEREFRVIWPDGSVHWLASRSIEVAARAQGQRVRVGVNWDITDKHTAQAAGQARAAAQRESQAKSEFLARMSHELRTPLNAVMGFSQLLLADKNLPLQYQQSLKHIHAAGQHLLSLTNDALDLSSLQSGKGSVQLQAVPLIDLVADTLPMLEPMVQGRAVHVHCGALGGVAQADASRLRQLLLHLVGHAIRVTPDGGRVKIETLQDPQAQGVLLRVTDGGAKLNEVQKQGLFEPFQRMTLQSLAPHAIEGSGVGLAIVKALAECMGGSVQVQDAHGPGSGSLFEVRLQSAAELATELPATPPPRAQAAALEPGGAATPTRRHRLLYIEDNPVNALIISELLTRRSDIELHLAEDGASGVALADQMQPDLALIDMQLPDMDGLQVLHRLRNQASTAKLRCIALSANAIPEDMQRARQAGMEDYWTKPLDFKAFLSALDRFFGAPPRA